jgi:type IV secretion system protein TrbL
MGCGWGDWGCELGEAAGDWISSAAGQSIGALANAIAESVGQTLASLGSIWVTVPTPNLTLGGDTSAAPPPVDPSVTALLSWAVWVSLIICVLSLISLGAALGLGRNARTGYARRLATILAAVTLTSGAASVVSALLNGSASQGTSSPVAFIQSSLSGYVGAMAIFSVVIAAARMAWTQRAEPGKELLGSLVTLVLVSGSGLAVIQLAVLSADALAQWILERSTDGTSFDQNIAKLINLGSSTTTAGLGPVIVIVLGFIALLASMLQIALMVVRGGMLVLLAGILPLSASFTNTQSGRAWFQRCATWTVAFVLYKPAAAVIYATAFQLVGSDFIQEDGSGLIDIVTGVALMTLALFALPALIKFLTPVVGGVASGGGVGALVASAASVAPTGARMPEGHRARSENGSVSAPPQGAATSMPNARGAATSARTSPGVQAGGVATASSTGVGAVAVTALGAATTAAGAASKSIKRTVDKPPDGGPVA